MPARKERRAYNSGKVFLSLFLDLNAAISYGVTKLSGVIIHMTIKPRKDQGVQHYHTLI
jgi:hypothetical protein